MQQALASQAATAAGWSQTVPNGLTVGGLQPASGYNVPGSTVWLGTDQSHPITQTISDGNTVVTINQVLPQAILNWQSFNIGSHTAVHFDQRAGKAAASTWTVLNRISDPTVSPTQILGSITAEGQVLVLNQNGVLFAPGSQVNLHSLAAGAVTMTDKQFLTNGIYSPTPTTPVFLGAAGNVTVEPGAEIATNTATSVSSGGGAVILLGRSVVNDGLIVTPGGQTVLAAGSSFTLQQGLSVTQNVNGTSSGNTLATVLGSEISAGGGGLVANAGLIISTQGDVTLVGQAIDQAGVILSTTSVGRQGTIHLLNNLSTPTPAPSNQTGAPNPGADITLEPHSVTEILPDTSAATALNGAQQAGYIVQPPLTPVLLNQSSLPNQPGLSRIEITSGGTVTFAAGAVALAPAGQIAIDAGQRINVAATAQLDVSGLSGVTLPATANQLAVNIEGFNLSDSPLNRNSGLLNSNTAYLDIRQLINVPGSVTADPQARFYSAGGLLQVAGELSNTGHTASEWATIGGTIYLYSNSVVSQPGSVFNIAGGSIAYQAGDIRQTYLSGFDGNIYNANTAPANTAYSGVYTGYHFNQPRWHVSDTYVNPVFSPPTIIAPSYTVGRDAGRLVLSTPTAVFAGTIVGGVATGATQTQPHVASLTDPFLQPQSSAPLAGTLTLGNFSGPIQSFYPTSVLVDANGSTQAALLVASGSIPGAMRNTAVFSNGQLNGLGGLIVAVGDTTGLLATTPSITIDAPLAMAPGAQVFLTAPLIDVRAPIYAPSGAITLQTMLSNGTSVQDTEGAPPRQARASVTIEPGVSLSTAGLFVNTRIDPELAGNGAFTNGGSISVESSGALTLAAGSTIDTSAGAAVILNGFSGGRGGSVSVVADDPAFSRAYVDISGQPVTLPLQPVTLDAVITSYGATTSGTLSLTAPQVLISASPIAHGSSAIALAPDIFTHGFNDYVINGFAVQAGPVSAPSVIVEPGTAIVANVPVLIESPSGSTTPSGAPGRGLQLYLPPQYLLDPTRAKLNQRVGASLNLASSVPNGLNQPAGSGGPVVLSQGASIAVDQGQSVTLESFGQVTADGAIHAPAGTISLLNLSVYQAVNALDSSHLSIWVGEHAVLDAAGLAVTALDVFGRPFGVVPGGGSIIIGGAGNFDVTQNYTAPEAFVFTRPGAVIDASGTSAPLQLATSVSNLAHASSGAGESTLVASAGGTISFVSGSGIYLDGAMRAASGGAGAAGGTLRIQLDTEQYTTLTSDGTTALADPAWTLTPHRILVSQATTPTALPPGLQPGQDSFLTQPNIAGQAAISQQQVTDGGFDNLVLFARDQIAFDGDVSLHTAQSITLVSFTMSETSLAGHATVSAPYVEMSGAPPEQTLSVGLYGYPSFGVSPLLSQGNPPSPNDFSVLHPPCLSGAGAGICSAATLTVAGNLIDLSGNVRFGANAVVTDPNVPPLSQSGTITKTIDVPGFNAVDFLSAGDIRLAVTNQPSATTPLTDQHRLQLQAVSIVSSGNLSFQAARIYPETGVSALISAGANPFLLNLPSLPLPGSGFFGQLPFGSVFLGSSVSFSSPKGAAPNVPFSTFGTLTIAAASIVQGGNVEAPLGAIVFDAPTVTLAPGSTTSVSANGLIVPFGGTTDGVSYTYAGQALSFQPASYGAVQPASNSDPSNEGIAFLATTVIAAPGSALNLEGGGTLIGGSGASVVTAGSSLGTIASQGFITGRGGSTDVLTTSLLTFNPATHAYSQSAASSGTSGVGVYAILPGAGLDYAPQTLLDVTSSFNLGGNTETARYLGSQPGIGEQLAVGAGVPGLAAGSYTLLPSYYALLPGAFRVQIAPGTVTSTVGAISLDGLSYSTAGYLGTVNTSVHSALPSLIIVTPGINVRQYSQYDEQSYAGYALAQAAVFGTPRPYLPQDAGSFFFDAFAPAVQALSAPPALQFAGIANLAAAPGGYDGAVGIITDYGVQTLEIAAPGSQPTPGAVVIPVSSINALNAPLLEIGGNFGTSLAGTYIETAQQSSLSVILDPGATLTAGAVWLFARDSITISSGAEISTLGRTPNLPDSRTGVVFAPEGALAVANGTYLTTAYTGLSAFAGTPAATNITIGDTAAGAGAAPVILRANDLVGVYGSSVQIAPDTKIGTSAFEISVSDINVGTVPAGAVALPGFDLTQATIDQLVAGDAASGAPALRSLNLTASQSLNFFGQAALNGSNLQTLVLTTPAIYGFGAAGDIASLDAANLVWNGAGAPGPVTPQGAGTGSGTLLINTQTLTLGYPAQAQAQNQTALTRSILGFANVDLAASAYVTANNHAALAVYQTQGPYIAGSGTTETGGNLTLTTPLLTTSPGAVLSLTAGGALDLAALPIATVAASPPPSGLGGEIIVTASTISEATSVVLPGGRLVLDAADNLALDTGARIDLAGRSTAFFDVVRNSWGGTLSLQSATGGVTQASGASIDVSAPGSTAGQIDITATSGTVSLAGIIDGAGGAGFAAGAIDVRAGNLGDLAALDTILNAGGLTGTRSFEQTGLGNVTIGSDLIAHDVRISVDQGSLTVDGTINASGAAPGTISLSAASGLTLAPTAVLDAHGTVLQTDSTGQIIAAENIAHVDLTASAGTLTILPGAAFDVASPDGIARGDIQINVQRITATSGDASISASGPITIQGAAELAVNAFQTYTPTATLLAGGLITQADLDAINVDSTAFMGAAVVGGALAGPLAGKLAGLDAYASAFHLRPGVEIASDAASGGNLTVSGDINLASARFAGVNPGTRLDPAIYGSGEPGVLWLRASGDLNVYGSLTDGFSPPPATPDDNGWVLQSGNNSTAQNIVLTQALTLAGASGPNGATTYPSGNYTLTYPVTLANGVALAAEAVVPVDVALTATVQVATAFVLNGTLTFNGSILFGPGSTVSAGTNLPIGSVLVAGSIVPANNALSTQLTVGGVGGAAGLSVPAGTNFSIFNSQNLTIQNDLALQPGAVIPALASIQFTVPGETTVQTRPLQGAPSVQGQIWGVAPLLPVGDVSWSLRLVSGANLAAADSRAVLSSATLDADVSVTAPDPGSLVLSDLHFGSQVVGKTLSPGNVPDFSVLRTGTGYLDLISGGSITEASLFGIYTAGMQSPGVVAGGPYDLPRPGGVLPFGQDGNRLGVNGATYNKAAADYQANYPINGGDLLVAAQHDVVGDTYTTTEYGPGGYFLKSTSSDPAQWMWWQGSSAVPGAWWINFGSFVGSQARGSSRGKAPIYLAGFTGFGTLGGGNATIVSGRDIGALPSNSLDTFSLDSNGFTYAATGAIDVTVASTGRADPATGHITLTGGGNLSVDAGATINSSVATGGQIGIGLLGGVIADLRGNLLVTAESVGTDLQTYSALPSSSFNTPSDPRPTNPFASQTFQDYGGPVLVLGDSSARIDTRGDLALTQVADATTGIQVELAREAKPATTSFSLWQPTTSVALQSLGGNVVPVGSTDIITATTAVLEALYPPNLEVTAFTGNVEFQQTNSGAPTLELSPAASGQLLMLAGNSILDAGSSGGNQNSIPMIVDISGASTAGLATPLTPSFAGSKTLPPPDIASGLLHQGDTQPARFYAVNGDIVGLVTGQRNISTGSNPFNGVIAGKAVQVRAGRDVVGFNGLVLNNNVTDISTIQAGRDVIYANEQIAGPGLLLVEAGRNVYQGFEGVLDSSGELGLALTPATRDTGAGITVLAGVGAGPNLVGFADLYLNPANLADPIIPLQNQPGRVERSYRAPLLAWLQQRYGYAGTPADALATFLALPQSQQTDFLLSVYFAELNLSGLDYNNPASRFFHSYIEGDEAIRTLFPATDLTGKQPATGGSLTQFSAMPGGTTLFDSSIHTQFGGGITTVVPYGSTSLGNYGVVPGSGAGVTTQGSGDINMYSYGSVTLGQSRVLTTFGGNILIWLSSDGEINAGRGSKSTVLNTPIGISYDKYGNIILSPTVPSAGAGIGTLSPIPQVPAGNVNLIAPVGAIDAGEAGIRASGNANIAALTLINASNIQVNGKSTGIPVVSAPSTAAQAAASGAAGSALQSLQLSRATPPVQEPSIIDVEVLSVSDAPGTAEERRRTKPNSSSQGL